MGPIRSWTARVASNSLLPRALAGVGRRERSPMSAPRVGEGDLVLDRLGRCEGNSGWVTTIAPTPADRRVDDGEDLVAGRCPVARTRSWRGDDLEYGAQASKAPRRPRPRPPPGSAVTPASRSSSSKRTQTGTLPSGSAARTSCCSFSELTVGSHTIRAPSRAAISTATGFSPPTARLSVIAPMVSTSGTAALTTARARRSRCSGTSGRSRRGRARRSAARETTSEARRRTTSGAMWTWCRSRRGRARARGRSGSGGRPARPRRRSLAPDLGRRLEHELELGELLVDREVVALDASRRSHTAATGRAGRGPRTSTPPRCGA